MVRNLQPQLLLLKEFSSILEDPKDLKKTSATLKMCNGSIMYPNNDNDNNNNNNNNKNNIFYYIKVSDIASGNKLIKTIRYPHM